MFINVSDYFKFRDIFREMLFRDITEEKQLRYERDLICASVFMYAIIIYIYNKHTVVILCFLEFSSGRDMQ